MTIDYINKITLQEELKNVKDQLKTVQYENAKLKADIDLYRKADTEKTEAIATLAAAVYRLSEEKRQKGDNLRNRIKDLEVEIDQPKSNISEEEVRHLRWEKDYLAKQVEHLQSCLDFEKDKE